MGSRSRQLLSAHGRNAETPFTLSDPAPHRLKAGKIEAPLMSEARVGEKRDIREGEIVSKQETRAGKTTFQMVERGRAAFPQNRVDVMCRLAQIDHLEASDGHVGLVAVLLPEQPGVHLCGSEGVLGEQLAAAGKIANDRVGLRERAAVVEDDRRTPRIYLQ